MKLYACSICTAHSAAFIVNLAKTLDDVEVEQVECMSGCTRAQTVAFRASGKTAYLFGDITEADIPSLETFSKLYAASTDGTFADARVLGDLRNKAIARIPA